MKKEFKLFEIGDVIWANPEGIGKHIFIICDTNDKNKVECYPSINLSSNCSSCEDCCIDIKGIDIPKDWFRINSDVSYLRIDNPICLIENDYDNQDYSFKGNLRETYSDLFVKICLHRAVATKEICSCQVC